MKCLKRIVVCVITDAEGNVLSMGRNECDPPLKMDEAWRQTPECARMKIEAQQEGYDGKGCNSIHAEINAIKSLPPGSVPHYAILLGHKFACEPCTEALRAAGVKVLAIGMKQHATGDFYFPTPNI